MDKSPDDLRRTKKTQSAYYLLFFNGAFDGYDFEICQENEFESVPGLSENIVKYRIGGISAEAQIVFQSDDLIEVEQKLLKLKFAYYQLRLAISKQIQKQPSGAERNQLESTGLSRDDKQEISTDKSISESQSWGNITPQTKMEDKEVSRSAVWDKNSDQEKESQSRSATPSENTPESLRWGNNSDQDEIDENFSSELQEDRKKLIVFKNIYKEMLEKDNDNEVSQEFWRFVENITKTQRKNTRHQLKAVTKIDSTDHYEGDKVILGKNGTKVSKSLFATINWSKYTSATRRLLSAFFSRKVMATHSLTGKPSPAFLDTKEAKLQLDPLIVGDIIEIVCRKCNVNKSEVRGAITSKCADENKLYKKSERLKCKS
ncbi:protein insensitive-like [Cylas formicarius]|uniref:protein insensitive-like n=1 Tax=Cylas formicarius TaxID=197179 RepID=UPI0029587D11|nr:protein insensitive-like [Cylas formicarius]